MIPHSIEETSVVRLLIEAGAVRRAEGKRIIRERDPDPQAARDERDLAEATTITVTLPVVHAERLIERAYREAWLAPIGDILHEALQPIWRARDALGRR